MTPERYRNILSEFDELVTHLKAILARLVGKRLEKNGHSYAEAIYVKLVCHAISLRTLSPTLADGELWDVASASAVARALIEAYDAMAYIAIHPVGEDEQAFRILLWELHDQQRRLRMLEKIRSRSPQVQGIRDRSVSLLAAVKKEAMYSSLSKEIQSKINRAEAPAFLLSQRQLNDANGVDHDYYTTATMFLSQYVHTFPMSVRQLMHAKAGDDETLALASMPLQYCMPFLAKAASGAVEIWPDGQVEMSEPFSSLLSRWLEIAEKGVGGFS